MPSQECPSTNRQANMVSSRTDLTVASGSGVVRRGNAPPPAGDCPVKPALLRGVHESPADIEALAELLERSYAGAGAHLLRIHTPPRRLLAEGIVARLTGMCLLALATVTADCRPIVGPVDGIFYKGAFHFGSSPDSVRFRHIRKRPQVSATHVPGEELAITVHGRAVPVDVQAEEGAGLRRALLEIYVPRYGEEWEKFLDSGPVYARIDADRMFTFSMRSA
jgi:Pyridoxamine 5'-phosphate oxidase